VEELSACASAMTEEVRPRGPTDEPLEAPSSTPRTHLLPASRRLLHRGGGFPTFRRTFSLLSFRSKSGGRDAEPSRRKFFAPLVRRL
jgi:hypothetical protein